MKTITLGPIDYALRDAKAAPGYRVAVKREAGFCVATLWHNGQHRGSSPFMRDLNLQARKDGNRMSWHQYVSVLKTKCCYSTFGEAGGPNSGGYYYFCVQCGKRCNEAVVPDVFA